MSNEQQFVIIVRYPEWEQPDFTDSKKIHTYPPFGVKYLFTTDLVIEPDWPEDDERWFSWAPEAVVSERFVKWYKNKIKPTFGGDILFIEPAQFALASDIDRS